MPVILNGVKMVPSKQTVDEPRKATKGHSKALPLPDLNSPGWLYLGHLLALFGISDTTLRRHIDKDIIPKPDGYAGTKPFWKKSTIIDFLNKS
jgi:hypothetical protein